VAGRGPVIGIFGGIELDSCLITTGSSGIVGARFSAIGVGEGLVGAEVTGEVVEEGDPIWDGSAVTASAGESNVGAVWVAGVAVDWLGSMIKL
jgi:hypothetical protein